MKVVSKNNSAFVLFLIFLDAIQNDELRSILLNLNINMNQLTLDDYKEAHRRIRRDAEDAKVPGRPSHEHAHETPDEQAQP